MTENVEKAMAVEAWERHLAEGIPLRLAYAEATCDAGLVESDVRRMSALEDLLLLLEMRRPSTQAGGMILLAGRQVYRAMGGTFASDYQEHLVRRATEPLRLAPVDGSSSPWRAGRYEIVDAGQWRRLDPNGVLGSDGIVPDFEAWVVGTDFWTSAEPRILLRYGNERFEVPTLAAA